MIREAVSRAMLREALDALILLIERVAPGTHGSVLLVDDDGLTLRHGAAPHLPAEYCRAIDGLKASPVGGSCGTAVYRRERVVVRDIATDPLWAPYRILALSHGLASCWSTPILDTGGRVLGTFAMYYAEPKVPTAADLQLTETATLLAKNAIKRARATTTLRARTDAAERLAVALQESEARFRMMAETIPVQVWTARPDGLLDFVTKRTAEFFGVAQHELLGDRWASRVHPDDIESTTARWKRSLESGERYETEFRLLSAEGEYRWHLVRAEAMFDEDGCIAEWFGCTADIEEHKRLETALDVAAETARKANRSKAEFLAMMSHELRTPLNAIGGYVELMIDGIPAPATEAQLNYLRRIQPQPAAPARLSSRPCSLTPRSRRGSSPIEIGDVFAHEVLGVLESLTAPQRAAKRLAYDSSRCDAEAPAPCRQAEARADPAQPAVERREVHAGRRAHHREHRTRLGRSRRDLGARHGTRHVAGGAGAACSSRTCSSTTRSRASTRARGSACRSAASWHARWAATSSPRAFRAPDRFSH